MLERLPRPMAMLLAALLLATGLWCLTVPVNRVAGANAGQYTDLTLYHDIVDAVRSGTPYYQAAVQLQRAHGYPTKPFVTVREPTLSIAAAALGWDTMRIAAAALLVANIAAWVAALPPPITRLERIVAGVGIALGGAAIGSSALLAFAELWCGLLLSLALALRMLARERWWLALGVAALGLTLRELALPFALLAAAFAAWQRRWTELAAWAALFALFSLGMAIHAQAVLAQVLPSDAASPGWTGGQGLRGALMALAYTSVWQQVWQPLALLACLLPVLGWATLPPRAGAFPALLLGGYGLMLALFARADNFYWDFMLLPAWFVGYALVPRGIAQLYRAMRPR